MNQQKISKILKSNKSKYIENILPVILFLILSSLVVFFINHQKDLRETVVVQSDPEPLLETTLTYDDTTVKRDSIDCIVESPNKLPKNWPNDLPLFENQLTIESECSPNEYDNYIVIITYQESPSYLSFAFGQELKLNGWTDIKLTDLSDGKLEYTKISANKDDRQLFVELKGNSDTDGNTSTSITYRERL